MHMADALISPAVGGTMWAVSGGLLAWCARRVQQTLRDSLVPMMGVLGAFVFAAQMINFSIPGTGSSGHLGGGLILAVLLGPHAAFLVIASVLTVQAFFFADGGLLALGCNIFNLGFFPAFVAYPLLYRSMAGRDYTRARAWIAAVVAAVAGLELGAFSVVLETRASGLADLPFGALAGLMLPIHLAIGVVEGLATAAVVGFVARARPEVLPDGAVDGVPPRRRLAPAGLAVATVLLGGLASWFASTHPDGLEWALDRVTGGKGLVAQPSGVHQRMAEVQEKTALLPDYGFAPAAAAPNATPVAETPAWPAVDAGTSVAGLVGGGMTLVLVGLVGLILKVKAAPRAGRKAGA